MDPVSKIQKSAENSAQTQKRVRGRPWPKGVSGNPGGRPKKRPISQIYEELFDDPEAREAIKKQVFQTMTGKGMAGVLERREAAERLEGKVTQQMELDVPALDNLAEAISKARKREKNGDGTAG